ncbi:MAG: transglutaminase-like domain-containing protein [Gemmatimonadota bacterium]
MRHRRAVGILILAFWMAMVGWQVRREYFRPELARLAEATRALAPGTYFYTLEMADRAIGLASSRLDTVPEGFVLEDLLSLELPALGQTGAAVARTRVDLSATLAMQGFDFSLDSDVGRFAAAGKVAGDSLLQVEIRSGSDVQTIDYRFGDAPLAAAVLPIRVAMGGELEVGSTLRLPMFDPSTLATRTVEVEILAYDTLLVPDSAWFDPATSRWTAAHYDSIPAWQLAESFGGIQIETWIDEDGRTLEASSPLGFTMRRTEFELARQSIEEARGLETTLVDEDVILATAVQSNVDLELVETYDALRFRLSGVDLTGFALVGGRQELRGDTLIVRREDWNALQSDYTLPYKRMDRVAELQPEPLIQSADERIQTAARRATNWGSSWTHDPKRVTRQLTNYVFNLLEKRVTVSVPSAVQVLESEQGDCNEHTVLFVALARSLGLPARTAVGLVYVNGAFFYHAWPEVWIGDWVAVDPTFGQYPADAAHLRFVVGGLAQQVDIVRLIGRLQIEVLDVSRGE